MACPETSCDEGIAKILQVRCVHRTLESMKLLLSYLILTHSQEEYAVNAMPDTSRDRSIAQALQVLIGVIVPLPKLVLCAETCFYIIAVSPGSGMDPLEFK